MASGADRSVAPPEHAPALFGDSLPRVERYAEVLAAAGVERGLIGPREVPRLWERHIMNCAVVEELIPEGATVVDIGSGAGLPGVVLALIRPDLSVTLLEPLLRRTVFLRECIDLLELTNVEVRRARAEEVRSQVRADIVTARAVAPLTRLAGWALPLLGKGGSLLALKGEQAEAELEEARGDLSAQRPCVADVIRVGRGKVEPATTVVRVTVTSEGDHSHASRSRRSAGGGRRKRGRKR
ncbi:16S rRNA (guanine(527)-N(7))-methyltransferase RsmG [Streptomonospora nanhaiensis]|uniref:Ribosomal RNA small subunit methyltransferase G n=1 Tax=Streptomonospora nanhaiensis TaxID=1323731 RepID=A0A853BPJ2_9ACTN|nr:16S rRNA (guanine(527)-N(7))-methyltransferase RsmG [Streptomonospora nanhaiensis]MBV2364093.1 16S rRNA (guanine(527)-N(7))-methyltransferase RsmG [Streptomonospora nanhaiensis]MBX9387965.1 16S rRNA (guanine(527)-N(7))-methyltransferase RsmG [Streptomonospora nanhaiensis]NYI97093.1 16S rRNA (guanine527-N7)-methyltransferase [Streptomonospora nanhaiensis]